MTQYADADVSIHAPHEGERRQKFLWPNVAYKFQSTLPTRGSDAFVPCADCYMRYVAGYASVAKSDAFVPCADCYGGVSIHAPHEGERRILCSFLVLCTWFQSTLPTRGSDMP